MASIVRGISSSRKIRHMERKLDRQNLKIWSRLQYESEDLYEEDMYEEDLYQGPLSSTTTLPASKMRVAYKGGAFSEVAALKAFLNAAEVWRVNKAILPFESTIDGSVSGNYDLLIRHRLHIVGEVHLADPQDDLDNLTRFLILAREPIISTTDKPFKTSIVFTLEEGPGVLFKALAVFALRDIKLIKIESRPQRKQPLRVVDDSISGSAMYFDYLFYIDFEASMADPRAQIALGQLQEFTPVLHVLGCYPMDMGL